MNKLLIPIVLLITFLSCKKESTLEQQIYFNSFESQSDTIGWIGDAFNFDNDVPSHGGKKSLSISGGCIIPHAEYTIDPQSTDCYLKFRFWGKNLSNGGGVWPSLTLGAIAGGISNSAILIDMIEITKLIIDP